MATRAAEERQEVRQRPVDHLGDSYLRRRGAPNLEAYPPPSGGSWQVMSWYPGKFLHTSTVKGPKLVHDFRQGDVISERSNPGILEVTTLPLSPATVNWPFPQVKGG